MPSVERQPPSWLTISSVPAPEALDGRACRTRVGLFTEAARVLRFPDYFGRNWDAFYDCLRDADPPVFSVDHAEELLADEPPEQLGLLLNLLSDAGPRVVLAASHPQSLHDRILAVL
ncbi:barstar family protein [Actinocorallia sp. B10E7]|uniref:barstar family protein n=1 Tax=Actinocorallia sp. B10E7 TaxID=3153558 RepID=UPI00325F546D